jgi:putative hydrolase of HD superfamily
VNLVDPQPQLAFLEQALRLKYMPRTGWLMRGLTDVESVADHTWGVALATLILAESLEPPPDLGKALTIALLHDLQESALSDIPTPGARHLPAGAKLQAEESILAEMLKGLPEAARLKDWWSEFEEGSSLEGQLVRDADRLDMLLQAYLYEQSRGCSLDEFWSNHAGNEFFLPVSQAVYEALLSARSTNMGTDLDL